MENLDGPHFSPDLIGPDGKLSRFHKGGRHQANALQAQANQIAARNQKLQQAQSKAQLKAAAAARMQDAAAGRRQAAALANANRQTQALMRQLSQSNKQPLPTEVIEDEEQLAQIGRGRRTSAYGFARTGNTYGLGGGMSQLG